MLIDPKSKVPIYQQIADQIRTAIRNGIYQAGESIPSLRALALEIKVNPNTVQRAYDELERSGVVESRRGIGVFVVDRDGSSPTDAVEAKVAMRFRVAINTGVHHGVSPARVRELFEGVLEDTLSKIRKPQ